MTGVSASAVIWDYDGTLADTRRRNYNVVRLILGEVAGRSPNEIAALRSPEIYDRINRQYANWRDLYLGEFGFTEEETDRVGRVWTDYQLADDTPAPVFEGIAAVLAQLAELPHGIVSMNGGRQIRRSVAEAGLAHHFRWIVGWEDRPSQQLGGAPRLRGAPPSRHPRNRPPATYRGLGCRRQYPGRNPR